MPNVKKKTPLETPLRIVVGLALFGTLVSLYMIKDHYSSQKSICDLGNHLSCSVINRSVYSKLFNVPVAVFGVIWNLVLLSFTLKLLSAPGDIGYWAFAHFAWSVIGGLFCLYFIYAEAVLGAICLFCTMIHVTCFSVMALSFRVFRRQKVVPSLLGLVVYFFQHEFGWVMAIALLNFAPVVVFNVPRAEEPVSPTLMEPLARCLTANGVMMYGSASCPFCSRQKDLFGASFQHVNYFDCGGDQELKCVERDVNALPTWIMVDFEGNEIKRHTGLLTIKELKEFSSCE